MISEIKNIFDRSNSEVLDKNEWVKITNLLLREIEFNNYTILQYRQNFHNIKIVENVIKHNKSHSHSVIYINSKYKLQKINDAIRLNIDFLYPQCISNIWKSNLISTSDFEDKLFYILSYILDHIKEFKNDIIINWIDLIYYIKKKSVNDILQKLIWEIYYQMFEIIEPIYVDVDVIYFNKKDWKKHKDELIEKILILSDKIVIDIVDIIPQDEKKIIEYEKR